MTVSLETIRQGFLRRGRKNEWQPNRRRRDRVDPADFPIWTNPAEILVVFACVAAGTDIDADADTATTVLLLLLLPPLPKVLRFSFSPSWNFFPNSSSAAFEIEFLFPCLIVLSFLAELRISSSSLDWIFENEWIVVKEYRMRTKRKKHQITRDRILLLLLILRLKSNRDDFLRSCAPSLLESVGDSVIVVAAAAAVAVAVAAATATADRAAKARFMMLPLSFAE